MGRLVQHGWDYQAAKAHLGKWYKVPVGIGAGVMGLGYWCFAANVVLTVFQARLVRVPKPQRHLWKFFATGALALTVGTVQGVIQVQPRNADWLFRARPRGRVDRPDQPRAHQSRHRPDDARRGRALPARAAARRRRAVAAARRTPASGSLLGGSLAFYARASTSASTRAASSSAAGSRPSRRRRRRRCTRPLIMGSGHRSCSAPSGSCSRRSSAPSGARRGRLRPFVLAGCAALAVGTLQGPVQAFPAVNELLDRGGDAGDVIVNLHAQLNMLGGLMVLLVGARSLALRRARRARGACCVRRVRPAGMGVYYAAGSRSPRSRRTRVATAPLRLGGARRRALVGARARAGGGRRADRLRRVRARRLAMGRGRARRGPGRAEGGARCVRRDGSRRGSAGCSPAQLAAYELPMGLLGFPGSAGSSAASRSRRPSCSAAGRRSPGPSSRSRSRRTARGRCAASAGRSSSRTCR